MSTTQTLIKEYHKTLKALNLNLNTFFGRLAAFEMILKEEHEKVGESDSELGMFRYKGMEQYGNIVSLLPTYSALNLMVKEYKWKQKWMDELLDWYDGRKSVDTITLYHYMKSWKV